MTRRIPIPGLTGLLLLVAACAPGNTLDSSPFQGSGGPVLTEIQNNHQLDVRVFALRYGDADRLGTVTSHTSQTFEFPRAWVDAGAAVAVRVEPIGGRGTFTTRDYVLEPGSVLEVTVHNMLRQSTVRIR